MPKCQASQYLRLPPPPHCHSTHWATQSYSTVTSLTMTPDLYLEVGTTSYRVTCWYKNLSYNDMLHVANFVSVISLIMLSLQDSD